MRSRILLGALVSSWVLLAAADPAQAQSFSQPGTQAVIRVIVPAPNAKIWFDQVRMPPQDATCRLFVSPPLERRKSYFYVVKASWVQDGREVSDEREVTVRPGEESRVDFTERRGGAPNNNLDPCCGR
ncbi:MAG: TIGR03000 domain-containing protein [Gemmataceae bacterium]|nr:TIGR03000 domain-containing protein [Gemmataceae bacterium]